MRTSEIDYSRKWFVMIAVSMGTLLATIDGSIVSLASLEVNTPAVLRPVLSSSQSNLPLVSGMFAYKISIKILNFLKICFDISGWAQA